MVWKKRAATLPTHGQAKREKQPLEDALGEDVLLLLGFLLVLGYGDYLEAVRLGQDLALLLQVNVVVVRLLAVLPLRLAPAKLLQNCGNLK